MARAAIFEKIKQRLAQLSDKQDRNVRFSNIGNTAAIVPTRQRVTSFKNKNFAVSNFTSSTTTATPESVLPFRVKFINIGIESYGPNNPAPIGIAIIGFNNYIL
jgi:hypothetical protein